MKSKKEKLDPNEPQNFEQFCQAMIRDLHDNLIQGGIKEMRSSLYVWLPYYIQWHEKEPTKK